MVEGRHPLSELELGSDLPTVNSNRPLFSQASHVKRIRQDLLWGRVCNVVPGFVCLTARRVNSFAVC